MTGATKQGHRTAAEAAAYLQSLPAVREAARRVYERAATGQAEHFEADTARLDAVAVYVLSLIERDYPGGADAVPPHSRWRHFEVGGTDRVASLLADWERAGGDADVWERARRVVDLFVVSVLLDAGAGSAWKYKDPATGKSYARSEGLAIASLDMFRRGMFSSHRQDQPHRVDAGGLGKLTLDDLRAGFQVNDKTNPLVGLENRLQLLNRLGDALTKGVRWFVRDDPLSARPGQLVDYLLDHSTTDRSSGIVVQLSALWQVVMDGIGPVWPSTRTRLGGIPLGDVWPLHGEGAFGGEVKEDDLVPFHKLSQWMTYSLVDAITRTLGGEGVRVAGIGDLTALPEYRNGGLLVDMGVLRLRAADRERGLARAHREKESTNGEQDSATEIVPLFDVSDPVIVEWRALTVAMIDEIADRLRALLGKPDMELAKVLEGGTWKAGREMAHNLRPVSKGPPIAVVSDGTVF